MAHRISLRKILIVSATLSLISLSQCGDPGQGILTDINADAPLELDGLNKDAGPGDLLSERGAPADLPLEATPEWTSADGNTDQVSQDALEDVGPQEGEAGWPCTSGDNCLSGFCIQTPLGKACTTICIDECPFGWSCVEHPGYGADPLWLCMPLTTRLCRPCTENQDCFQQGADIASRCLSYGAEGAFCGAYCDADEDCPEGYDCLEMNDVAGVPVTQCSSVAGICACDEWAVIDEASTDCYSENLDGSCPGTRQCTPDGLTDCDAPTPGPESCNGLDDDCDGEIDEDSDGDECIKENDFGQCQGVNYCLAGQLSCDAQEPAPEICDGLDNNCDGETDEGYPDTDEDGVADCLENDIDGDGVPDTTDNCPTWANDNQADFDLDGNGDACDQDDDNDKVADGDDCQPLNWNVFPGAPELCNGIDDDCDTAIDEELGSVTCGVGTCLHTAAACSEGAPHICDPMLGAAAETCDGLDNDCDGLIDEQLGVLSCGVGPCDHTIAACLDGQSQECDPMAGASAEVCNGVDDNCNGEVDEELGTTTCGLSGCEHTVSSCVGGVPFVCDPYLGAEPELCDGVDNDCDGQIDEELGSVSCGTGPCNHTVPTCLDGQLQQCDPMAGAAAESCDGIDNDCNGLIDDGLGTITCGQGPCDHTIPSCFDGTLQDCDSFQGATPEVCNGVDDNCDGEADEDLGTTTCGLAGCEHTVPNCLNGIPQACNPYQGAEEETCDGLDNDCDGEVDESLGSTPCGQGVCFHVQDNCADGEPQQCDPLLGALVETCDGIDNDCDGFIDEEQGTISCGQGSCAHTVLACVDGAPQSCDPLLGASDEVCNGVDDDCDGETDEDLGTTTCGLAGCEHAVPNCLNGIPQACNPYQGAEEETCDGVDNDCDGSVDEDLGFTTCGQGNCFHVQKNCIDGAPHACDPMEGAEIEVCDGLDGDCDGVLDGTESLIRQCGATDAGACEFGTETCNDLGAWIGCDAVGASQELCNGIDDDCDGVADGSEGLLRQCGDTDVGQCTFGLETCDDAGQWAGCTATFPSDETCNGLDDDCDGVPDSAENLIRDCGDSETGACTLGTESCDDGGDWVGCDAVFPAAEECNGVDDDCDGIPDGAENLTRDCGVSTIGECTMGTETCDDSGDWAGCTAVLPLGELCNGLDDDCDGEVDGDCYVMTGNGGACNGKCASLGLDCLGPGSVGTNCRAYQSYPNCMSSAFWIFRSWGDSPQTGCYSSWGTCDVCSLNYNSANAFCCHCGTL